VIFTSDHGDMLGSQGLLRKQQPWEESIHIPMVFRAPGRVPAGRVSDALIGVVDLLPTICGLSDVAAELDVQGLDLSKAVTGEHPGRDEVLIMDPAPIDHCMGKPGWWGLRTPRWTYARTLDGPVVLCDNERDPHQLANLVSRPESAEVRDELDARVLRRFREIAEPVQPWSQSIREAGLAEAWNARQRHLHPHHDVPLVD
jgi:arylsulfatase A-like enzyme